MSISKYPVWPRGQLDPQMQRYLETVRKRLIELDERVVYLESGGGGSNPWTSLTDKVLPKYDSGGDELVDSIVFQPSATEVKVDPGTSDSTAFFFVNIQNDASGSWGGIGLNYWGTGGAYWWSWASGGTETSPSATVADQSLLWFEWGGSDNTPSNQVGGYINVYAAKNWVAGDTPTSLEILLCSDGSSTPNLRFEIDNSGTSPVTNIYGKLVSQASTHIFEMQDNDYYQTDARRWQWRAVSNIMYFRAYNWAESSYENIFKIQRNTTTTYRVDGLYIFPDYQSTHTQIVYVGSGTSSTPGAFIVGPQGGRSGIGIQGGGHLYLEGGGGATPANEIRWSSNTGSTVYATIWCDQDDEHLRFINRQSQQHVLDTLDTSTNEYWEVRLHTTSGPIVLKWSEGNGLGWTESTAGITAWIADSADVLSFPIANATYATWEQSVSGTVDVLEVDGSNDTRLNCLSTSSILLTVNTVTKLEVTPTTGVFIYGVPLTLQTSNYVLGTGYRLRDYSTDNCALLPRASADYALWRGEGNVIIQIDSDNGSSTNVFQVRHDSTTQTGGTLLFEVSEGLWITVPSNTDASRPTAGTAGRVFFNTDDGNLNIDDGTNWILPDGTTT